MDKNGVKELARFSTLNANERDAVMKKYEGVKYAEIALAIGNSEQTISDWFMAGGRLIQAYMEYQDYMNEAALRTGKALLKKATVDAANVVITELKKDGGVYRMEAATLIINKFYPTKTIMGVEDEADDTPPELISQGEEIVNAELNTGASNDSPVGGETP